MSSLIVHSATLYDGSIGGVHQRGAVLVENGKISKVLGEDEWQSYLSPGTEVVDASGAPLVPGYIDIHHHGGAGHAYDEGTFESATAALEAHAKHGTTRSVLSTVTNSVEAISQSLRNLAPLVEQNPQVLGFHAEGPFLHPQHKGAHPEDLLRDPDPEAVAQILDAAGGHLLQVTMAPEREGGLAAIESFVGAGTKVAVGHTSATYEQARDAFSAGASLLTHTFNGMNGIHHRAPGPVIAALEDSRVSLEIINDGIHVHPSVVAQIFGRAPERTVLVTDAMSATCNADGIYMLGTLEVEVKDGVATLVEGNSLAGSTLTMDRAVALAVQNSGQPLDLAVAAATSQAAAALDLADSYGRIAPGYPGDLLLLDAETLLPTRIWRDGVQL